MTPDQLRFEIPFAPASLKNSQRLGRTWSGKANVRPSAQADAHKARLRDLLRTVLTPAELTSRFGDDDVAVRMLYHARTENLVVEVRSAGPRPKGFAGRKRDLHNMADLVLDGLQLDRAKFFGGAYDDDRQVVRLELERVLT